MLDLLQTLSTEWATRALIACIMVGITCGVLGCFIVLKNMSLIGDALSHSILPGIYVAFIIVGYSTLGFFIGSVIAGLITAIAITWIQQNIKTKNDAAIGIVFTAMFSIGVMGISRLNNTQGNHLDLKDFLFGNVLGVSNEDLILSVIIMIYTLLSILIFYRYFFITTFQPIVAETMGISNQAVHYFFMLMLSFAVVAALRSVGVILVVAMLITPASTAMLLSHKMKKILFLSALIGMISAILGLIIAIVFDTVPGPSMVLVSTFFFLLATLFSYDKGIIPTWYRNRKQTEKIIREDIVKFLSKLKSNTNVQEVATALDLPIAKINNQWQYLINESIITSNGNLTIKGINKAEELVRAHRLWETYQVNSMGLSTDQIHDDAEIQEHHLTGEIIDELDQKLGYPELDPHGSPIPKKNVIPVNSILNLKPKSKAIISKNQDNELIESELWELGILPNTEFMLSSITEKGVEIKVNNQHIMIPSTVAVKIRLA